MTKRLEKTMKARVFEEDNKILNTMLLALSVELERPVRMAELINGLIGAVINGNREPSNKDITRIKEIITSGGYNRPPKEM